MSAGKAQSGKTGWALLMALVKMNKFFLLLQLNERSGQFIGMVENDRLLNPIRGLCVGWRRGFI
jgi:hypothetical protein